MSAARPHGLSVWHQTESGISATEARELSAAPACRRHPLLQRRPRSRVARCCRASHGRIAFDRRALENTARLQPPQIFTSSATAPTRKLPTGCGKAGEQSRAGAVTDQPWKSSCTAMPAMHIPIDDCCASEQEGAGRRSCFIVMLPTTVCLLIDYCTSSIPAASRLQIRRALLGFSRGPS